MVALSVPRLGFQPTPCLSRMMLFSALDAFDRGQHTLAGIRLREAVRQFLTSLCKWHDVRVDGKHPSPAALARALDKAGVLGGNLSFLLEMIEVGNAAAHCRRVDRYALQGGIAILFSLMDGEGCIDFQRTPLVTSHKTDPYELDDCDDDDDRGDDWKAGAA